MLLAPFPFGAMIARAAGASARWKSSFTSNSAAGSPKPSSVASPTDVGPNPSPAHVARLGAIGDARGDICIAELTYVEAGSRLTRDRVMTNLREWGA